jgi:hypothetical protein
MIELNGNANCWIVPYFTILAARSGCVAAMPHRTKMENKVAQMRTSRGGAELPAALRKAQRVRAILIQLGQRGRRARDAGTRGYI